MKLILSAYACEPNRGSEPEVGWRWANAMSADNEVVVITRSNNKDVIENHYQKNPHMPKSIRFVYYDLSPFWLALKKKFKAHELYYLLWQRKVRKVVDKLISNEKFDLVHLVTFASFRYPVFLSNLSVPVVWGPVGGAEKAPLRLLFYKPTFKACARESLRNVFTSLAEFLIHRINPTKSSGGVVIASTTKTYDILHRKGIAAEIMPTIGMDTHQLTQHRKINENRKQLKLVCVGRLVVLKGIHFALEALARRNESNATLTIVGDGPERKRLESMAKKLEIVDRVKFLGYVEKSELPEIYKCHDVVLAPSLYESGGYMVLEGYEHYCPAIVMNVGGLAMSVDDSCGIKIDPTGGREVVEGFSRAIEHYENNPEDIITHGKSGHAKLLRDYSWNQKVKNMNKIYQTAVSKSC